MTIELSFLSAVALAGMATFFGESVVHRSAWLQREYFPEPALGGLAFAFAFGFLALHLFGVDVKLPLHGPPVDFLVALLTTNMGLHITPPLLRQEAKLFPVFLGAAAVLFLFQLGVVLPVALMNSGGLREALLAGPVSFVGAPFNLNPPAQIPPIAEHFQSTVADPEHQAQGSMMLGVLAGFVIAGLAGKHMFEREEKQPPHPSPTQRQPSADVWTFASQQFAVVVLVLGIVAAAFGLQGWLLAHIPWLKDDYLPIIVIAYLGGAAFRLAFEAILGAELFPEQALGVVLLGPTMGIVLSYALMSIPLALIGNLGVMEIAAAVLAVGTSLLAARVALSIFAKLTDRYYAAAIATAFLAVTTGWGPLAMSYLRRFTTAKGPVPVMPVVLPLNAFFVFPWMVILLTRFVLAMFG